MLIESSGWTIGLGVCATILLAAIIPLLVVREDLDEPAPSAMDIASPAQVQKPMFRW